MVLKPIAASNIGGNIMVEIDKEEYHKGIKSLKYSIIGKLMIPRDEERPMTIEIKRKLLEKWNISDIKVISLGNGLFYNVLRNLEDQL